MAPFPLPYGSADETGGFQQIPLPCGLPLAPGKSISVLAASAPLNIGALQASGDALQASETVVCPEPTSLALLGSGLLGWGFLRGGRRKTWRASRFLHLVFCGFGTGATKAA